MDPVGQQQQQIEQGELNDFGKLAASFVKFGGNATRNLTDTFSNVSLQGWIRLIVIVGGYMLLRPYVMKFAAQNVVKNLEEDDKKAKAQISPNELRGIVDDDLEIDEEGDGTGADWGQKARVRQRTMLKDLLEAEERRRAEEEDDKDIEDLLED